MYCGQGCAFPRGILKGVACLNDGLLALALHGLDRNHRVVNGCKLLPSAQQVCIHADHTRFQRRHRAVLSIGVDLFLLGLQVDPSPFQTLHEFLQVLDTRGRNIKLTLMVG